MRMYDIIKKKRDGRFLTEEEIRFVVDGFTKGEIPDYQMSAWLMCVFYQGMTKEETTALTLAMADSGEKLDLSAIEGVKVDKHSTGGVGDKTTFIVAPILAVLGIPIAKMSGRGLGHTGGTVDKLMSIPGFSVEVPKEQFIRQVNELKLSLVAQTGELAPADKKIYALRDVTTTVDSLPLIASSIMSKKIAAGADAIVLDVKCGSGAFMKSYENAVELGRTMTEIGALAGRRTCAVITDMNEPLGHMVGNSLELYEALKVLSLKDVEAACAKDRGLKRLVDVSLTLAAYMLAVGEHPNAAPSAEVLDECRKRAICVIESGEALNRFADFVKAQGGDTSVIYDPEKLPVAKDKIPVYPSKDGYLAYCSAEEVGMASLMLGGGRATKESTIDVTVGIELLCALGEEVKKDEPFAYIYASENSDAEGAKARLVRAYDISETPTKVGSVILGSIV